MTILEALPELLVTEADPGRWPVRMPAPAMLEQGVHVWRVDLDVCDRSVEQLARLLDRRETERARRFHFDQDRRRFVVSHGALRLVLALLIGIEPAAVSFALERYGKPGLNGTPDIGEIRFNMSHSDNVSLIAVARGVDIGIDVERVRTLPDALSVAEHYFAQDEVAYLQTLVAGETTTLAFYECWTRKEAIIKGLGTGLSCRLASFSVMMAPGRAVEVDPDRATGGKLARWSVVALKPAPGFAAALAVSSRKVSFHCWSMVI